VRAWHAHNAVPKDVPPDEDEILHARRIVAQRCLYGVDKNSMAVDLAKLSLWLATLAKDHPFTFLDHALKCGDSLVGLTKAQILGLHWKPDKQRDFARAAIEGQLGRALEQRRQIREAPDGTSEGLLQERLQAADGFLNPGRRYGDLVVSAFFAADNDRRRRERLEMLSDDLAAQRSQFDVARHQRLEAAVGELRRGPHPVIPFHWEIEFPEVFDRANPGFDAFVGNPPFLRGKSISTNFGTSYTAWILATFPESNGSADLSAHFFRRVFGLLRSLGCMGLIATNSIAQGDTRSSGLRWISVNEGTIYQASRRLKWPGQAAVVVSLIHIAKGTCPGPCHLDGRQTRQITAYLFHAGDHENPRRLKANAGKSHYGTVVSGVSGFTFDDTEPDATPLAVMEQLLSKNSHNRDRIKPYIGGDEVNTSPSQSNHRYIIDFEDFPEDKARQWPDLFEIVERKVMPSRDTATRDAYRVRWWQYVERQAALYEAIRDLKRALVINCGASPHMSFAFIAVKHIFANSLTVVAYDSYSAFCVVQSRVHEVWARFFSSSMKDDLRYTPTFSFETFPFPTSLETNPALEATGRAYYEFRAALMVRSNQGLTKIYNRFHDPDERSPDILKLRELHTAMDRAVLDAYGWTNLKPTCEFLLDYEEDEDESGGARRRKKPWRYRWPDDFRDEVLARLLELNRQRVEEERLSGAAESGRGKSTKKSTKGRKADTKKPDQPEFFES